MLVSTTRSLKTTGMGHLGEEVTRGDSACEADDFHNGLKMQMTKKNSNACNHKWVALPRNEVADSLGRGR